MIAGSGSAVAQAWTVSADYTADVSGPVHGAGKPAGRVLDNLEVDIDGDLAAAFGWTGATAHLALLNNSGGQPNGLADTLQGVDNIEVARPRGKIYEAWLEQAIGQGSVRVGLYDLNGEFYTTGAAALLIAPAFGIGSELAATGPNGPSIFPSTALAARVRYHPSKATYVLAAAINAHAGVIGDPGGVDVTLEDGALFIGEAGWTGRGKVAVGAWRYSRKQPRFVDAGRNLEAAQGFYLTAEQPIGPQGADRQVSAFLRMGVSEGETTPFTGGGQAGFLVERFLASRPDAALSAGFNRAFLSHDFRALTSASGARASTTESSVEITYRDRVSDRITLQPSLQFVLDPRGDAAAPTVTVLTLRARVRLR